MKVTMNDPIRNVDGTEIKNGETSVLFVDIIITALVSAIESDKNEDGPTMLKKWDLADDMYVGP